MDKISFEIERAALGLDSLSPYTPSLIARVFFVVWQEKGSKRWGGRERVSELSEVESGVEPGGRWGGVGCGGFFPSFLLSRRPLLLLLFLIPPLLPAPLPGLPTASSLKIDPGLGRREKGGGEDEEPGKGENAT